MPQKEFSKSMKAKMYDFTYTPFMSSMVIAWIILNHKYILIYMASIEDFDMKLKLLKNYDFSLWGVPYMYNIIMPISFGLFYTFIYPFISKYFYKFTLNSNKKLKTIKKDIEDNTPITVEEAKALKKENYDKTEKILELEDKITAIRSDYDMKLTTIEEDIKRKVTKDLNKKHTLNIKDLEQNLTNKYKKEYDTLEKDCTDTYQSLNQKNHILNSNIKELQDKNKELERVNKALLNKIPKGTTKKESDEDKVLRYLYQSNYNFMNIEQFISNLSRATTISRIKMEKILYQLLEKNFLEKTASNNIFISENGKKILLDMFDK